jgi:hypothetical protein
MVGFVRRYWMQVAGVATVLALVAVLAVVAFRPSGNGGAKSATVRSTTTASRAMPDPREQVKAVARAFLQAVWDSAKTGKYDVVDTFVKPETQAAGTAGIAADNSIEGRHNFIASRIEVLETSWRVDVGPLLAHIEYDYRLFGHDADWPSLRPRESDHETETYHDRLDMQLVAGKWLIYNYN